MAGSPFLRLLRQWPHVIRRTCAPHPVDSARRADAERQRWMSKGVPSGRHSGHVYDPTRRIPRTRCELR